MPMPERDSGCWIRYVTMRPKNSASPVRPMPRDHATATTTPRWRRYLRDRQTVTTASVWSKPKPRSTTCAPHSHGVAKMETLNSRWRWHRPCRHCGNRGPPRGLHGSTPSSTRPTAHHLDIAPAVRARALADRVLLAANIGWYADLPDQADEALTIARQLDNPALLTRALAARGLIGFDAEAAQEYRAEAIGLARKLGDRLRLSHILSVETLVASITGDVIAKRAAAQEGCELAEAIGYRTGFIRCRWYLGLAQLAQGDCAGAVDHFRTASAAAEAGHYANFQKYALAFQGITLAWQGDTCAARAAAGEGLEGADELGSLNAGLAYTALGMAALAAGDAATARSATDAACLHATGAPPGMAALSRAFNAQAALAGGDLLAARRAADAAITTATGWYSMWALITRARVALAQDEPDQAERDAYDALACATEFGAQLGISDILEGLAGR